MKCNYKSIWLMMVSETAAELDSDEELIESLKDGWEIYFTEKFEKNDGGHLMYCILRKEEVSSIGYASKKS